MTFGASLRPYRSKSAGKMLKPSDDRLWSLDELVERTSD